MVTKPLVYVVTTSDDDAIALKVDGKLWQSLEFAFISIVLALPLGD